MSSLIWKTFGVNSQAVFNVGLWCVWQTLKTVSPNINAVFKLFFQQLFSWQHCEAYFQTLRALWPANSQKRKNRLHLNFNTWYKKNMFNQDQIIFWVSRYTGLDMAMIHLDDKSELSVQFLETPTNPSKRGFALERKSIGLFLWR